MKKLTISLFLLSLLSVSVFAQSYRLQDLSSRLLTSATDVADSTYRDFKYSSSNSKSDIDALMIAQQLKASAEIFRMMVQDRRSDSELRDAASNLTDLARRAPYNYRFNEVKSRIDDISRALGGGSSSGGGYGYEKPVIGRVRWRGTVDDEVNLIVRGNTVEVQTISGQTYSNGFYNFTSSLPGRRVDVEAIKKKGRGSVRVIQEPRRENNFTAVVQIRDKDSGAKDYDIEIVWR